MSSLRSPFESNHRCAVLWPFSVWLVLCSFFFLSLLASVLLACIILSIPTTAITHAQKFVIYNCTANCVCRLSKDKESPSSLLSSLTPCLTQHPLLELSPDDILSASLYAFQFRRILSVHHLVFYITMWHILGTWRSYSNNLAADAQWLIVDDIWKIQHKCCW